MATRKKGDDYPFALTGSNNDKEKSTHQGRRYERINIPSDIVTKANEGDATAELELGKFYYSAVILENNDTIAFEWIRRSAEQGNMEAQFILGNLYALGFGTAKSLPDSYKWYTKAAIQGYKKALIRIHNLYQEDIKMHCRGHLNDDEKEYTEYWFKKKNKIRELYEYRLKQSKAILNGATEYYTQQFKQYQLSDQKDPSVQLNLAFLYQHGYGVKKGSRWAFEYYSLAAEQGDIDAQYNLGRLYQQHTRKKFNYRDAFKWYTESAKGGSIAAQRCLAYFYLKGLATDIDYKTATSWYTTAAEAGDSQAQVTLGMLYRKGDYLKQDLSMAVWWYTLAARQGNIVAQNCLSQLHRHDMLHNIKLDEDILEYLTDDSMNSRLCSKLSTDVTKLSGSLEFKTINKLTKHALVGDGPAMYQIGLNYYHGTNGFPRDKDTGVKWIKSASNKKHKDAQLMMAELYRQGDSIEQDYRKAYIWYKVISKQKDAGAQCQVGIMYLKGLGVRKDPLEASKWFTWAADQGNSDAQYHFGMLRLHGNGIRKDEAEAKKWLYKSIQQRNNQACYILGKLYLDAGKESYWETGLKLLEFAAKDSHADAQSYMLHNNDDDKFVFDQDILKSITFYTNVVASKHAQLQYEVAVYYLNESDTDYEYTRAYNLLSLAKDKGHKNASGLFQTPIKYGTDIDDCSKVLEMFIEVTEKGLVDLSYNIGSILEQTEKDFYGFRTNNINLYMAEKWYLDASRKGDSRADYRLGILYEYGKDVEKNMVTAIDYYKVAAKKGNKDAIFRLACMYLTGYNIKQDTLEAFHLYTKAYTMGHRKATEVLTIIEDNQKTLFYSNHTDIDFATQIDRKDIVSMLEEATKKGYTQLQYQLGVMYERANNSTGAFKWLSLAADIGVTDAYYRLGVMHEEGGKVDQQNYEIAADMYQMATKKDHEEACFRLGRLYQYGNGVSLDYLKAYSFYKKAADMGHDTASKVLNIELEAKIQMNGRTEDNHFDVSFEAYKDSLKMLKYVAEHGDTDVQFKVGYACEINYIEPEYGEVLKWYSMAARGSHREAIYRLGLLHENGLGVFQDYEEAIKLYTQAFKLGSNDALHRLGTVYHYGKGVEIDPAKAIEYYTLSAEFGNPKYQCALGQLYEIGELVQESPLEVIKWYTKAYLQGYDDIRPTLYAMYEDKPYESFFFQKLFQNLSVASCNNFSLNDKYEYKYLGDINDRLGFMYLFGIGTEKNSKRSLHHLLKSYPDKTKTKITDFSSFDYSGFSFNQKVSILKEIGNVDECMNQLMPNELYSLGMMFYDGKVESQNFNYDDKKNEFTLINNVRQHMVIEKDCLTAFNYLKRAADKNDSKALLQLGFMYLFGIGIDQNSKQAFQYFTNEYSDITKLSITEFYLFEHSALSFNYKINILKEIEKHKEYMDYFKPQELYNLGMIFYNGRVKSQFFNYDDKKNEYTLIDNFHQHIVTGKDYLTAFNYLKKAADKNDSKALLQLGFMYLFGIGIDQNSKQAFQYFTNEYSDITEILITEFYLFEHSALSFNYKINILKEIEKHKEYMDYFKPQELYNLGMIFYNGKVKSQLFNYDDKKNEYALIDNVRQYIVIEKDYLTAFNYLKRAADRHYQKALLQLGFMYLFGIGIDQNSKQAFQYFTNEYSDITKISITEFYLFEHSALSSSCKINILKEIEKHKEYMYYFEPQELYELGMVFYNGKVKSQFFNYDNKKNEFIFIDNVHQHIVIKKDYLTAFNYLKRAADKHYRKALLQLGIMYNCGYGVQKDTDQGDKYFDLVANSEIELLIEMAVSAHTKQQSFSEAFACYKQLEKRITKNSGLFRHNIRAIKELVQNGLGLLYEYGDGIGQDYQKAIDYYKTNADGDCQIGYLRLGLMYYYGKGVPVDYKKAWDLIHTSTFGNVYGDSIPYVYYEENNLQTSNNNDVDYSKRRRVYCTLKASEINGEYYYYRGPMYKHGQGVEKDEATAQRYFRYALEMGCQRAANELKED